MFKEYTANVIAIISKISIEPPVIKVDKIRASIDIHNLFQGVANGNASSSYSIAIAYGYIPYDRSAILHQGMSEFNASIGKLITFFTSRLTKASLYRIKRCTKGHTCNFHIFSRQMGPYDLTRSIMTILLCLWPTW